MTLNSSIYRLTKDHLRHSTWMIILSVIGHLLAGPILYLFADTLNHDYYIPEHWTELEIIQNRLSTIQSILSSGNLTAYVIIAMCGAAIVAFGTFYYLFQSSKLDLYHSLPLTRKELFTAAYLNGVIIWFIPFIISNLVTFIIACIRMNHLPSLYPILVTNLKIVGIVFLTFFIVYHLCLVAIMLCGNLANALICTVLYGFGAISVYGLFIAMFAMYFETFYSFSILPEHVAFLSPLTAPVVMLIDLGNKFTVWKTILYVGSALLAFANICIATQLHKHRKTELAGNGIAFKPVAITIRGILALIGGLIGVCFVQVLGYDNLSLVWDLVFGLFVAVFVYGFCCAIQQKSVKAIWKHKLELVVTAAVMTLVILFFHFDLIGYDTYLPRENNIKSMQIRISALGNRYYDYEYGMYSDFSSYVCEDPSVIYSLLDTAIIDTKKTVAEDYYNRYTSVLVHVSPKVGLPYYREYYIDVDSIDVLRPIAEDPAYIQASYAYLYDAALRFNEASIFGLNHVGTTIEDSKAIAKLRSALIKDMELHSTIEEQSTYLYVAELSFSFKRPNGNYTSRSFNIPSYYENTLQVMSELMDGFVYKAEDLDITGYNLEVWYPDSMTLNEYLTMEILHYDEMYGYKAPATTDGPTAELIQIYEKEEGIRHTFHVSGEDIATLLQYASPADSYVSRITDSAYYNLGEFECRDRYSVSAFFNRDEMTEDIIREIANILEK